MSLQESLVSNYKLRCNPPAHGGLKCLFSRNLQSPSVDSFDFCVMGLSILLAGQGSALIRCRRDLHMPCVLHRMRIPCRTIAFDTEKGSSP